jgi:serine protease Do
MASLPFAGSAALAGALADVARRLQQVTVEVRVAGAGGGSGVVWPVAGREESALVVTNAHVARDDVATVVTGDGRAHDAVRLVVDPARDLAVLRLATPLAPVATVRGAATLRAGAVAVAVGAPLGVPQAIAVGVIHGVVRDGAEGRLVRSDVRLLPGNSGGPLADARGTVVGINTLVERGMGVAVASEVVTDLVGGLDRPRLGVSVRPVAVRTRGAVRPRRALQVIEVEQASPAALAGLARGDVLLAADGRRIDDGAALRSSLDAARARGRLVLEVGRAGRLRRVDVPLALVA